jgi:hypothetical protein
VSKHEELGALRLKSGVLARHEMRRCGLQEFSSGVACPHVALV